MDERNINIDPDIWSLIWDDFLSENEYGSVTATGIGGTSYYLEAVADNYNGEKLLINKQLIKTGINDIPRINGLLTAIQKEQPLTDFLADLKQIHEAYAQSVSQEETAVDIISASARESQEDQKESRSSRKAPSETSTAAQLLRENKRLEERVAHFKGQLKLSKD